MVCALRVRKVRISVRCTDVVCYIYCPLGSARTPANPKSECLLCHQKIEAPQGPGGQDPLLPPLSAKKKLWIPLLLKSAYLWKYYSPHILKLRVAKKRDDAAEGELTP